jgi:hypothetical protein
MPFAPPQAPMRKILFSFANKIEVVSFIKSKVAVKIRYIRIIMLYFLAYSPQMPIIPQQPICPSGIPSGPGGVPIYPGID